MTLQRARSIGITGNIASGKSSVARRLGSFGATVIDADDVARECMRPGLPAWKDVVATFGAGVLDADGTIDRPKLRGIVFSDRAALQRLNAAVHPHVHAEILRRLAALGPSQVGVVEAVALVEAGTNKDLGTVWLVLSPPELQIARLMETRGLTREDAAWRVAAQSPAEDKLLAADVVLHNAGSLDALHADVDRAWRDALARWGVPNRDGRLLASGAS